MLQLHLLLLRLLETVPLRDVSYQDVQAAGRNGTVIPLLRQQFAEDATFRHFDGILNLNRMESDLDESILTFQPRAGIYGFHESGLCFLCAAIAYSQFRLRS